MIVWFWLYSIKENKTPFNLFSWHWNEKKSFQFWKRPLLLQESSNLRRCGCTGGTTFFPFFCFGQTQVGDDWNSKTPSSFKESDDWVLRPWLLALENGSCASSCRYIYNLRSEYNGSEKNFQTQSEGKTWKVYILSCKPCDSLCEDLLSHVNFWKGNKGCCGSRNSNYGEFYDMFLTTRYY